MKAAPLALEDLRITLNGTFVRSTTALDAEDIDRIIDAARANEDPAIRPLMHVLRRPVNGKKVSAFVYFARREAYFLPDRDLYDSIASYIVIVEVTDTAFVIFKKSCGPLTPLLEKDYEIADYGDLINTFDDSRSMIQKLSTREMNVSDKGMRSRGYEAPDLKGHMSPLAAGRSIPRYTQVRSKNDVRSLSLTTGRINQLTDRATIVHAVEWGASMFDLMGRARVNKSFFSAFAQRISLEEVIQDARPASILFERASIEEQLAEEKIDLVYAHLGKYKKFKPKALKRLLGTMDIAFEVDAKLRMTDTRNSTLKVNKKSISFNMPALKRLKIKSGKNYITFQSWITDNGHFVVSFDKPEYIYLNKNCFQDKAGKSEVESILKCLQSFASFATVSSEKGLPKSTSTRFDDNSLFHQVEQLHLSDDYIFCDDLGTEWADHITINLKEACVTFVHSKHAKKTSNSASALHEVVGQAIKNLGNMHFSSVTFSSKVNSKFKLTYSNTRIARTRKGNASKANADIKGLLADHRLHRKCIVACTSLSKREVEREFMKMKRGVPVKGNITQLFWILSSLIHSCQGSSTVPIVFCKD